MIAEVALRIRSTTGTVAGQTWLWHGTALGEGLVNVLSGSREGLVSNLGVVKMMRMDSIR